MDEPSLINDKKPAGKKISYFLSKAAPHSSSQWMKSLYKLMNCLSHCDGFSDLAGQQPDQCQKKKVRILHSDGQSIAPR
jgi:hypothetical protein